MADAPADELKILVRRHSDGSVERFEMSRLDELDGILAQPGAMACVRITNPSSDLIDTLQREFGLHPLAVEDLRKRHQRPKIDAYAVASNSLNVVVKRLTAFTVILMVPTLIAGIYGMNFDVMPELHWPLGYPLALALMLGAMAAAVVIFRRQGWF